jgi:membrane-associated phospholipid phosphatase
MRTIAILLLLAAPAAAGERTPFLWTPPRRPVANGISWGTAIGSVALDTVRSFKAEHRKTALLEQACGLGVAGLAMRTTKHLVHRDRPDGSDDRSFYSGHTTYSAVSTRRGYGFGISFLLTVDTAFFRQAAGKHYPSDTIVGALAGLGSRALCAAIIPGDR